MKRNICKRHEACRRFHDQTHACMERKWYSHKEHAGRRMKSPRPSNLSDIAAGSAILAPPDSASLYRRQSGTHDRGWVYVLDRRQSSEGQISDVSTPIAARNSLLFSILRDLHIGTPSRRCSVNFAHFFYGSKKFRIFVERFSFACFVRISMNFAVFY